MTDLLTTAPGTFANLYSLATEAANELNPSPMVFPFELNQYEPGSYVMISGIRGPEISWENIGTFSQIERFSIYGKATVYTGLSLTDDPTVAVSVLSDTYTLFQQVIMTPIMSNRFVPILGAIPGFADGTMYSVLPAYTRYEGMPGNIAGGQNGWSGVVDWAFNFEAYITPA